MSTVTPQLPAVAATLQDPLPGESENRTPKPDVPTRFFQRKTTVIALGAVVGIFVHLILRFAFQTTPATYQLPLLATLAIGGLPLLYDLLRKLLNREFGSDLLGGMSIVTSLLLGEYLAGSIIVLMLSGGEALESYALRSASSVLAALAKRMPSMPIGNVTSTSWMCRWQRSRWVTRS